jgi:hypothetical protein
MRGKKMHFEILVEDQSGKKAMDILVPKIVGRNHTWNIRFFKGIGHIPKNMRNAKMVTNQMLLNNLPKLLRAYGRTFAGYVNYPAAVVVICDLDDRECSGFRQQLVGILNACNPKPDTRFCIAIEEGEAWLLGDLPAVKAAFPHAKENVLNSYVNDSICGTWEKLADAVLPGGAASLSARGYRMVGFEKAKWAEKIPPHMTVKTNRSPSFQYFLAKLGELAARS